MAKVNDTNRWAKNQLFYTFTAKRDFGRASGLDQAGIERKFQKACDQWGAQAGLTFTKVGKDNNSDISVGWGKLERTAEGALKGGITEFPYANLATIAFNDDVSWTADVYDKNYADFFSVAIHEIGHAIGMDHSSDPDAVMCPTGGKGGGLPIFQGLGNDDAVGARYLYLQPALDRNPGFPEANKIILLVNETPDFDVAYDIWVTNDKDMAPLTYLGQGNIKPSELTYWIEKKDFYNEARRYRVRVQCNGQSFIKDGIAPQNQVSFFYSSGRKKGYFFVFTDRWGDHGER